MLDNPIWHSPNTRHADLAIVRGLARRYPPDVAPFGGVSEPTVEARRDLEGIVRPGDRIGILGVIPPLSWKVVREIEIHQYAWPNGRSADPDAEAMLLGEVDVPAMLELTALVYPAYFREGTAKLGDYAGFYSDPSPPATLPAVHRGEGRPLSAMAGIRMAMDGYQEISAICTHPDYRGRGLAGRLTRHLIHQIQRQGDISFLHTESDNPAKGMYEKLGFELHQILPFRILERP